MWDAAFQLNSLFIYSPKSYFIGRRGYFHPHTKTDPGRGLGMKSTNPPIHSHNLSSSPAPGLLPESLKGGYEEQQFGPLGP